MKPHRVDQVKKRKPGIRKVSQRNTCITLSYEPGPETFGFSSSLLISRHAATAIDTRRLVHPGHLHVEVYRGFRIPVQFEGRATGDYLVVGICSQIENAFEVLYSQHLRRRSVPSRS